MHPAFHAFTTVDLDVRAAVVIVVISLRGCYYHQADYYRNE